MYQRLTGWWIEEIALGSDAEGAGLVLNDVIVRLTVNGVEYSGNALYDYLNSQKLKTLKVGDVLEFYVYRYSIDGYASVSVTVTEYGA